MLAGRTAPDGRGRWYRGNSKNWRSAGHGRGRSGGIRGDPAVRFEMTAVPSTDGRDRRDLIGVRGL